MSSPAQDAFELSGDRTEGAQAQAAAARHVEERRVFQAHAAVFALGMTAIVLVNLATNAASGIGLHLSTLWSVWAFIGWGLGIAVHGGVVWLNQPSSVPVIEHQPFGARGVER